MEETRDVVLTDTEAWRESTNWTCLAVLELAMQVTSDYRHCKP